MGERRSRHAVDEQREAVGHAHRHLLRRKVARGGGPHGVVEVPLDGAQQHLAQRAASVPTARCLGKEGTAGRRRPALSERLRLDVRWSSMGALTGTSFAEAGNTVTLGYLDCPVTSENATTIVCTAPRHVGGTYTVRVHVPQRALAPEVAWSSRSESERASQRAYQLSPPRP